MEPNLNINEFLFSSTGRATWTKHVRNGIELPEIARDDHYDFNFQVIYTSYQWCDLMWHKIHHKHLANAREL